MRVLRSQGMVPAPRDRVFAILEDPRMTDQIHPPFLRTAVAAAPWLPRAGARTRLVLTYRGSRFELETELHEYRRGSFLLERQVDGPFVSFEHAASLEDAPPGTALTEVLAYRLPLGPLGAAFDWVTLRHDLAAVLSWRRRRLSDLLAAP